MDRIINGIECGKCIAETTAEIVNNNPVLWKDYSIESQTSNSLFIWIKSSVDECLNDNNLTEDHFKNLMKEKIKQEIVEISDSDSEGYASTIWDKIQDKCKEEN